MADPTIDRIEKEIKSNKVVLFIKGTPAAPQCGFSAATMELFKKMGVAFHSVDILANSDIRADIAGAHGAAGMSTSEIA